MVHPHARFFAMDNRDATAFGRTYHKVSSLFKRHKDCLSEVMGLAVDIREQIGRLSPFIEQAVQMLCPRCDEVCCITRHGRYSFEDIIYLSALGLTPLRPESGRPDSDPCQFLTSHGCSLSRDVRPSVCNWYFCPPLLDYLEECPGYGAFDTEMTTLAHTWLDMIDKFSASVRMAGVATYEIQQEEGCPGAS